MMEGGKDKMVCAHVEAHALASRSAAQGDAGRPHPPDERLEAVRRLDDGGEGHPCELSAGGQGRRAGPGPPGPC